MNKLKSIAKLILCGCTVVTVFASQDSYYNYTYKYTPVIMDETFVMVPYDKIKLGYIPPANSIAHTTIETVDGTKLRVDKVPNGLVIEGHRDQVVLLEIFGYTCPHCIASIPTLNTIRSEYSDEDLYILSIQNYHELDNNGLKQYVKDHNIKYDTISWEKAGDLIDYIYQVTGTPPGVPWTSVFNQKGELAQPSHLGDVDQSVTESWIDTLLN